MERSDFTRPTGKKAILPHNAITLRLMEDFATRKSSNEHGFFVTITSLNKIGEEMIRELTGNIPFPVTFKCIMLVAVASLNKISGGRIRDHIGASRLTLPGCKPIMFQKGVELTKLVFVLIIQTPLSLFDIISEEKL